jgi:hypothetical protein
MEMDQHLGTIIEKVTAIYEKYKADPYMGPKTQHFICNQLETTLENIERTHCERTQRIDDLTTDQNTFMQAFLFHNHYFYHPTTEQFFFYDGEHYSQCSEDDIIYNILSTISKDGQLMSWKQKTKVSIMKRIKDNHIYQSIPESDTIQQVLGKLYPAVFPTKTAAKYFLTVLGDNILKKDTTLIHIAAGNAKSLVNCLNVQCQAWFGTNACQTIKYKYHAEHSYQQIRLLTSMLSSPVFTSDHALDMLCVACHYSNRYQSSDNYLIKYSNDDLLINATFYLKTLAPNTLVDMFRSEYIRVTPTSAKFTMGSEVIIHDVVFKPTQITWKNMYYLWKHFLDSKRLPNVVFTSKLKSRLIEVLSQHYDAEQDAFNGVNSKYLPNVCKFLQFWEETMVEDASEIELEISEIATLFKLWRGKDSMVNMSEKQIVDIIEYFYPDVEIDGDKYIYRIRNTMWDKQMDIQLALDELEDISIISAYDAYVHYTEFMNRKEDGRATLLVSKPYFDKFFELQRGVSLAESPP